MCIVGIFPQPCFYAEGCAGELHLLVSSRKTLCMLLFLAVMKRWASRYSPENPLHASCASLQDRVTASGGKVLFKGGSHRVMGLLAMSRAIGDHFLRPYVIPEPEVRGWGQMRVHRLEWL